MRFFHSNLTRDQTIAIGNLYCGELYSFALPWHNTLVWTAIAVPPAVVLLGLVGAAFGLGGWFRRSPTSDFGPGLATLWATFMVLRALPQAPGHDGTRQLALAFLFLVLLGIISVFVRNHHG